jgi:hypothetical protein
MDRTGNNIMTGDPAIASPATGKSVVTITIQNALTVLRGAGDIRREERLQKLKA